MRIIYLLWIVALPALLAAQPLSQIRAEQFTAALAGDSVRLFIDKETLRLSERLEIRYTAIEEKAFVAYRLPAEIKTCLQNKKSAYMIRLSPLGENMTERRDIQVYANGKSDRSNRRGKISESGEGYAVELKDTLLITTSEPVAASRSKKFEEVFRGKTYHGERYLIIANASEVRVYDLHSDLFIADYLKAFALPPKSVPKQNGRYRFTIRKDVLPALLKILRAG